MDTRGRSRSKTPSINLRISSDRETDGEKIIIIKHPDVETINEEDSAQVTLVSVTKTISNDTAKEITVNDPVPEKNNIHKEIVENEINNIVEQCQAATESMRTSTPKPSSRTKKITTEILSPPQDPKVHAAYHEYREAGEYWNKYPKTDYTYSELSPHRREVAPGYIAMPNMSRRSLDKHQDRVRDMIARNPSDESYIRQRYASSLLSRSSAAYDSQDELDLSEVKTREFYTKKTTIRKENIIKRIWMTIVTVCLAVPLGILRIFKRSESNLHYRRKEEGLFTRMVSFNKRVIESIFTKLYLLISSILCLDTWLLQRSPTLEDKSQKKRKLFIGLLVLLPLLLFGGIAIYIDPTPIEFAKQYIQTLPTITLPEFSKLSMPSLDLTHICGCMDSLKMSLINIFDMLKENCYHLLENMKYFGENAVDEISKIWNENVKAYF